MFGESDLPFTGCYAFNVLWWYFTIWVSWMANAVGVPSALEGHNASVLWKSLCSSNWREDSYVSKMVQKTSQISWCFSRQCGCSPRPKRTFNINITVSVPSACRFRQRFREEKLLSFRNADFRINHLSVREYCFLKFARTAFVCWITFASCNGPS